MQISATVHEGVRFGVDNMQLHLHVDDWDGGLIINPEDDSAAQYSIYSTPGRNISLSFSEPLLLFHSSGSSISISDFKLLIGNVNEPEKMSPISPDVCSDLRIPENGQLHFRIGGELSGDIQEYGIYRGSIVVDSQCLEQ